MPTLEETIAASPQFKEWWGLNQGRNIRDDVLRLNYADARRWAADQLVLTVILPAIQAQEAGEKEQP